MFKIPPFFAERLTLNAIGKRRLEYALRAGNDLVGMLIIGGPQHNEVTLQTAAGEYAFEAKGFAGMEIMLLNTYPEPHEVGTFHWGGTSRGNPDAPQGTVGRRFVYAGGASQDWHPMDIMETRWEIVDKTGEAVVRLQIGGTARDLSVDIEYPPPSLVDGGMIVYFLMMGYFVALVNLETSGGGQSFAPAG